jgi:hypothetical protein
MCKKPTHHPELIPVAIDRKKRRNYKKEKVGYWLRSRQMHKAICSSLSTY